MAVAEPIPKSVTPGISWPAVVAPDTALLLALQRQFEHSERLAANELERLQLGQLERVLAHAHAQAPFWRDRLQHAGYRADRPLTLAAFRCIPIMQRKDLQAGGESCDARIVPREHGAIGTDATSGSTAEPVRFRTTDICKVMWHAITLREHLWHGRDFKARLAAIRSVQGPGDQSSWGLPADIVFETGPAFGLRVSVPIAEQAQWLVQRDPEYLVTYPSNLLLLARECIERGLHVPSLREARTFGERLPEDLRAICKRAWNVNVVDMYSAQEVGYVALQCPRAEHYHVQAENVFVEILDEHGDPCREGETGRVIATSLNNFATPFIRYDLGDYAELGSGCACGRGLPVLRNILGRARNMAMLPDGGHFWPRIRAAEWFETAGVREFRLVQTALDAMRLEVVAAAQLSPALLETLREGARARLGHPFTIDVVQLERIERSVASKRDDFVCAIGAPLAPGAPSP